MKSFLTLKNPGRTRSSSKNLLVDTFKSMSCTYDKSLRVRAIKIWNSLPNELNMIVNCSKSKFKTDVIKWLLLQRIATPQNVYQL